MTRPILESIAMFQHTAARRRLPFFTCHLLNQYSFNTQPPEGGWLHLRFMAFRTNRFQHTAARRRLIGKTNLGVRRMLVSTHSRPKAAALETQTVDIGSNVSTHSRPKAAESLLIQNRA